jgi:hypothetical protein
MAALIALGIAVATVAFVAAPFFLSRAEGPERHGMESDEVGELLAEKEVVYDAIQELDFDLQSGKLSAEDHAGLRRRHEERAALLLQQIDALQPARGVSQAGRPSRREKRKG